MEFDVYSIGDSEFLEQILIALAMISGVDDFRAMVQVGMAVGVLSTVFSAIAKGGKEIEFQHILLGYILWATMFVPTARVTIEDTYTGDVRVVDNVPIGPAAAGGIISLIGYKVTELFEVAYNPIVPKVTENEFAESLRILKNLRNKASSEAVWESLNMAAGGGFVDLQKSWVHYITDCTLKKVDMNVITLSQLARLPYDDAIRFDSVLFGTKVYLAANNANGQNLTCAEAFADLAAATNFNNAEVQSIFNQALGFNSNNTLNGISPIVKTQSSLDALFGAGVDAQRYMETAVLEPILMKSAQAKYDSLNDIAGSAMVNQAIQQRNTTWAAEQTLFMSIVRPMLAFFEAFTYAVAPIMAFVIVLGAKGIQLAGKYFTMMIWIQLWMPLLAICNLYIYTASKRELDVYAQSVAHNWDSFYALNGAAHTAQNWIATGGLLASSTPAIALMLIYGSAVTATHLAGRLRSDGNLDPSIGGTPDLMKQSPVLGANTGYAGDSTRGVIRQGAEADDWSFAVGSQYSAGAQSITGANARDLATFQQTLSSSVRNSDGQTFNAKKLSDISDTVQTMSAEEKGVYNSTMNAIGNSYGQDATNSKAVQGAAALYTSGGISGGELSKALGVELGAGGKYQTTDTASNSEATKRSQLSKELEQVDSRGGDKAAFASQLAERLSNSTETAQTRTWANDETVAAAQQFTNSAEQVKQYQESAAAVESLGSSTNFRSNDIASRLSTPETLGDLREKFNALSISNPNLIQSRASTYANTPERFGNDQQRDAYAIARALTDQSAYKYPSSHAEGVTSLIDALQDTSASFRSPTSVMPGAEGRNADIGSSAPDGSGNSYGSVASAPELPSGGNMVGPITDQVDHATPSSASGITQADHNLRQASVDSQNNSNFTNISRSQSANTSAFKQASAKKKITDFNSDSKSNDLADNAALHQVKGTAEVIGESVSKRASGVVHSLNAGHSAGYSAFDQKMSQLGSMSPQEITNFNGQVNEQFEGKSGFDSIFAGAKEAGMSTAGFLRSLVSGDKPDGMSNAAYAQYSSSALELAMETGSETYSSAQSQLLNNIYQGNLEEAHQAGLPEGSNTASMYANLLTHGSGSEQFKHSLADFKMEFVPENTDNFGYEYNMVDGQRQYVTDDNGYKVQHFTTDTDPVEGTKIILSNKKYEDYTNNAESAINHGAKFGSGSDSEGGMIRLSEIENLRH